MFVQLMEGFSANEKEKTLKERVLLQWLMPQETLVEKSWIDRFGEACQAWEAKDSIWDEDVVGGGDCLNKDRMPPVDVVAHRSNANDGTG